MSRAGWMSAIAAILTVMSATVAWEREPTGATAAPVSFDGAVLFQVKGCAACHHGPDSTALIGSQFPSLVDASSWAGSRRPNMTAADYLSESIREPWAFISPGTAGSTSAGPINMPVLGLSEAEAGAIIDYLLVG